MPRNPKKGKSGKKRGKSDYHAPSSSTPIETLDGLLLIDGKYPKVVKVRFYVQQSKTAFDNLLNAIRRAVSKGEYPYPDNNKFVTHDKPLDSGSLRLLDLEFIYVEDGVTFELTVRVQTHDCYAIAIKLKGVDGKDGDWFFFRAVSINILMHFLRDAGKVKGEITELPFGESYQDLGDLDDVQFGYWPFVKAIKYLAKLKNPLRDNELDDAKIHFKNLIVFIIEAARFNRIGECAGYCMRHGCSKEPEKLQRWKVLIKDWSSTTKRAVKKQSEDPLEILNNSEQLIQLEAFENTFVEFEEAHGPQEGAIHEINHVGDPSSDLENAGWMSITEGNPLPQDMQELAILHSVAVKQAFVERRKELRAMPEAE